MFTWFIVQYVYCHIYNIQIIRGLFKILSSLLFVFESHSVKYMDYQNTLKLLAMILLSKMLVSNYLLKYFVTKIERPV